MPDPFSTEADDPVGDGPLGDGGFAVLPFFPLPFCCLLFGVCCLGAGLVTVGVQENDLVAVFMLFFEVEVGGEVVVGIVWFFFFSFVVWLVFWLFLCFTGVLFTDQKMTMEDDGTSLLTVRLQEPNENKRQKGLGNFSLSPHSKNETRKKKKSEAPFCGSS